MKKALLIALCLCAASVLEAGTFTEFCVRSGGSNLNAGTRKGNTVEPGTSADFTYANGTWTTYSSSAAFLTNANPVSDGVSVGDWASVYANGSSSTSFVARVLAVGISSVQVSLTAKGGVAPSTQSATVTMNIGGAWAGPSGAVDFPFGLTAGVMTDVAGDITRIDFKNDHQYNITATLGANANGPIYYSGYGTVFGDQNKAVIDGGTSGTSFSLLQANGGFSTVYFTDFEVRNNGNSGTAAGINFLSGSNNGIVERCVVHDVRGTGVTSSASSQMFVEGETYNCNQSNGGNQGGINANTFAKVIRWFSHNNSGSNSVGVFLGTESMMDHCVVASNGGAGVSIAIARALVKNSDFFGNGGAGILYNTPTIYIAVENCNFLKNGSYGIDTNASGNKNGYITNCFFGSGTQANTSGPIRNNWSITITSTGSYATDTSPYLSPDTGDFRLNNLAGGGNLAKGAGRGTFTLNQSTYTGSVGYPDIGSNERKDASNILTNVIINSPSSFQ